LDRFGGDEAAAADDDLRFAGVGEKFLEEVCDGGAKVVCDNRVLLLGEMLDESLPGDVYMKSCS